MPDSVETYAGVWTPWWAGKSQTAKSMTVLPEAVDAATMQTAAGLDWEVGKKPVFVVGEHPNRVPGWNAIQRETDGAVFGMVRDGYHLFQNTEGFDALGFLLEEADLSFLTAGSLFEGAFCWALAKVGEFTVRGDGSKFEDYLLGHWGHDGKHAFTVAPTVVRVVCANTVSAALQGARSKIAIRHSFNMDERIVQARTALDIHRKYIEILKDVLDDLSRRPMTYEEVSKFTEDLLPVNPDVERPYRTESERAQILLLFAGSTTLDGVAPTAYRAYQCVAEYADHIKVVNTTKTATSEDRRALSIIEGTAASLKTSALRLLVKA